MDCADVSRLMNNPKKMDKYGERLETYVKTSKLNYKGVYTSLTRKEDTSSWKTLIDNIGTISTGKEEQLMVPSSWR